MHLLFIYDFFSQQGVIMNGDFYVVFKLQVLLNLGGCDGRRL